jgi:hypothetical protein
MASHNHPRFSDPDFEPNLMPIDSYLHIVDEYDDDACVVTDSIMTPEQEWAWRRIGVILGGQLSLFELMDMDIEVGHA